MTKNFRKENEYYNQLQKESSQEPRFVFGGSLFQMVLHVFEGRGGPPFTNQDPTLIYVFEVSVEQLGVDKERVHYPTVVNQHDGRKLARQVRER